MTYDRKCLELAEHFMSDNPSLENQEARTKQLAQEIQTLIDDVIDEFETEDRNAEGMKYKAEYDAHIRSESDLDPRDPKSEGYAERMYEAADMERKRIREEGK